jgi:hypothetical protein
MELIGFGAIKTKKPAVKTAGLITLVPKARLELAQAYAH